MGRDEGRDEIAAPYRMSGEHGETARFFCFAYMREWFAVWDHCMSNTGNSAIRQQMSRIPAQIARTETINLILLNMKTLSRKKNKTVIFISIIIPNRADTITIAESRAERRGHVT